jgi:hypothetical protein
VVGAGDGPRHHRLPRRLLNDADPASAATTAFAARR